MPEVIRASPLTARPRRWATRMLDTGPEPAQPQPAAPAPPDAAPSTLAHPRRIVATLEELDEMLAELDRLAEVSDDELRRGFTEFRMELDIDVPEDPYSPDYRAHVFEMYEFLHGRPYDPSHESTPFDSIDALTKPFPYSTMSPTTVGNQLMAIGHIVKAIDLAAGASVLEFGPGWGNTTLTLAQTGYRVTAIDIEPRFVELIEARADRLGVDLTARVGDFSTVSDLNEQFDAVLFFECFHHSADHLSLLEALDRVVAPGGKIVFAAEPITEELPYPWGLRQDGESLWAIRKHGWLELGFTETYFLATLERFGWLVDKRVCDGTPWGVVYVATRR